MKKQVFQSLPEFLIYAILVLGIVFNIIVLGIVINLTQDNQRLLMTLGNNSAARTAQINQLEDHVNCIVALFTVAPRENLVISNDSITNCKIVPN